MLQVSMFCIPMFCVIDFEKAFVSLEEQQRVAAQAYGVYRSTMEKAPEAHLKMLQDVT